MRHKFAAPLIAAFALAAAFSLPAYAQSAEFSDQDFQAYAHAAVEIQEISGTYMDALRAATSPEEQETIRQTAQAEMADAIEEQGLSVGEYNQIYEAAQEDPDLERQIVSYMQEAR